MTTILLCLFILILDITPVLIFWILTGIIKRKSVANISNNDNNENTKCCVTEIIVHDKISAISLSAESKYKKCVYFWKYLF